ncbi:MAG TPA: hypothetical protein VMW27_29230 [Thermoanaerobaculia bacterium]|nr:hypothetical protein [Thermoanaerobaculia bacterium]
MAKLNTAFANEIEDLESLITATEEHQEILPTCIPHRQALVEQLGKIREGKALRDSLTASRQKATQDLQALLSEGRQRARRLRGAIQADLGLKTEQLVQFGIAPQHKRRRTKTPLKAPGRRSGASLFDLTMS